MTQLAQITIGTPLRDPYGSIGYVCDIKAAAPGGFVIGAGMAAVRQELEIAFPNRVSSMPDGIAAPMIERARGIDPITAAEVEEIKAKALETQRQARAAAMEARADADRVGSAFRIEAAKRCPDWAKAVFVAELEEDNCDSMSDYYNARTVRTVILGFSRHTRDLFAEMRKAAATFAETAHLADAPDSAEHREKHSMGGGYYLKAGHRYGNGWKVSKQKLYRGADSIPVGDWSPALDNPAAPAPAASAAPATGCTISEHVHSKKGFAMWIVQLAERVDRAEFERLLDDAKAHRGWYSRAWNGTPAGFAFKQETAAREFAGSIAAAPDRPLGLATPPSEAPAPRPAVARGAAIAEKLRGMADALDSQIAEKFADRLSNTPKRQRQAQSARLDGYRLQRTQAGLRALADAHEAGTVPAELTNVTTKAAVFDLVRGEIDSSGGYYDAGHETGRPAVDTPTTRALWAMLKGPSEAERAAHELRRKVDALKFANIPGYFPTPAEIVARMIDAADIPAGGCLVLEPSAGSGAILDAVKEAEPSCTFEIFERHCSLRDILESKGYTLTGSDFIDHRPAANVARVLMNPPFEKGQDMEHVRHAFECLEEGGRLVAIMSPGPFFRQDSKAGAFRSWFDALGGEKYDLPAGAFKESGTGVASVMVVLDR